MITIELINIYLNINNENKVFLVDPYAHWRYIDLKMNDTSKIQIITTFHPLSSYHIIWISEHESKYLGQLKNKEDFSSWAFDNILVAREVIDDV